MARPRRSSARSATNAGAAPAHSGVAARPPPAPDGGLSISILFARYQEERQLGPKASAETETAIRRVVELQGDLPIGAIARRRIRAFKGALVRLPADRSGRWRGKTVVELLREAGGLTDLPRLSPTSVKESLGAVAGRPAGARPLSGKRYVYFYFFWADGVDFNPRLNQERR